jgi:hypothetical protein
MLDYGILEAGLGEAGGEGEAAALGICCLLLLLIDSHKQSSMKQSSIQLGRLYSTRSMSVTFPMAFTDARFCKPDQAGNGIDCESCIIRWRRRLTPGHCRRSRVRSANSECTTTRLR